MVEPRRLSQVNVVGSSGLVAHADGLGSISLQPDMRWLHVGWHWEEQGPDVFGTPAGPLADLLAQGLDAGRLERLPRFGCAKDVVWSLSGKDAWYGFTDPLAAVDDSAVCLDRTWSQVSMRSGTLLASCIRRRAGPSLLHALPPPFPRERLPRAFAATAPPAGTAPARLERFLRSSCAGDVVWSVAGKDAGDGLTDSLAAIMDGACDLDKAPG